MEANEAFKNQNYAKSINLYSDAIELPDLSEEVLSILYSNRSSAYLKLSIEDDDNVEKARDDAKLAINCRPSWWKAYYKLGCIYEAKRKYDKAIIAYNKALSLDPSLLQVRSARDACRNELEIMKRKEHLDPQKMPMSRDEIFHKFGKRTGIQNMSSDKMRECMKTARKTGDPFLIAAADVYLAHHYLTGMEDVRKSYEEAAKLFAKAAAAGNAEGIYNLAILTKQGQGVKRDIPEAIRLLRQAAALPPKMGSFPNIGVAEAQHTLGICYDDGVGVDPNPTIALKWYEKGFENGCSGSANNLGIIYENGKGVPANIERAIQYWKSAASDGNVLAMESLERHYLMVGDIQQAKLWWQCAMDNGSVTAAQRTEMHTENECKLNFAAAELGSDWQDIKNCIDEIALRNYSNKQSPSGSGFRSYPDFSELYESATKGSVTAKKLVMAFDHFIKGMDLFQAKNQHGIAKYIHQFAEAYRIENIVPRWDPEVMEELKHIIELHLKNSVTQEPSDFELDLRVCYISLKFLAMDKMLEFSEVSIKRFPNESYFYDTQQCILGFLERYPEGLRKANISLKKFPNSVPLLYNRAVHTRLSDDKPKETIDVYQKFLTIAPRDHRKTPECYYAIATCYLQLDDDDACQEFYDLGEKAEKDQLSCFLPYKSNSKDFLSNMFRMKSLLKKRNPSENSKHQSSSKATSSKHNVNQTTDTRIQTTSLKPTMTQLTNPYRIQLTIAHRQWVEATIKYASMSKIMTTAKGKHTQHSPANLIGLKPITFREMDITKDRVYEGFVLQVSNIEDAGVGSSIKLLLVDDNHDFQRGFVYNYSEICNSNEIQKKLGFGCSYSILNPYMRIAQDMKPGIRIDDPRSIIINSTSDQSKKCRFCLSGELKGLLFFKLNIQFILFTVDENLKKCARCKRVWYCSKECQNNDWKLLKHKIICTPS